MSQVEPPSELDAISRELEDLLIDIFNSIIDESDSEYDNKDFSMRYKCEDIYSGGRDKGVFVIGYNKNSKSNIEYVYRKRFHSDELSGPNNVYWYSDKYGLKSVSRIWSEKDLILDIFTTCKNRGLISERELSDIKDIFDHLDNYINLQRDQYNIDNVKNAINEENENILQNIIASSPKDSIELWKLLYSKSKDGSRVSNEVKRVYDDYSKVVYKSKRKYDDGDEVNNYNMYLMIEDNIKTDSFFIHRIPRDNIDETKQTNNLSLSKLNTILGVDFDHSEIDDEIVKNKTTRLIDNIAVEHKKLNPELRKYRHYFFPHVKEALFHLYQDLYNSQNNISINSHRIVKIGGNNIFEISDKATTDQIKDLQSEIGISEKEVRKIQEKRNIGRLSSRLRGEIVKDIYYEKVFNWLCDIEPTIINKYQSDYNQNHQFQNFNRQRIPLSPNVKSIETISDVLFSSYKKDKRYIYKSIKEHVRNKYIENTTEKFITKSKYKIRVNNAKSDQYPPFDDYNINRHITKIFVPQKTELEIILNNQDSIKYQLPKGVYEFKKIPSVNIALYN